MATNTSFDSMLKDYMPYSLLQEEVMKRDFFLNEVEKDQNWKNGPLQVPFIGGSASSIAYGQLTDQSDITEFRYVRGEVSSYKELWGSMVFNDRDLSQHTTLEQSFIAILPDQLEMFIMGMKEAASINLLNGSHIATFDSANAANDLANGIIGVDRPARLHIGQYLDFGIVGTVRASGYVGAIDMNLQVLTIVANKDLSGGVVDLSAAGVIAGDRAFVRGAAVAGNAFTSLRDQLLSVANGGSANLFGISKLLYPHLQAYNFDGSGITATNILDNIFEAYNKTREIGKGNPAVALMSFKNLGNVMKELETARDYEGLQSKANVYGWTEITVVGVKGQLKLVGVQEMDDDIIHMLDMKSMKLHSNDFFERRESPDGTSFYETRSSAGYQYIVDTRFYGELVVSKPSHSGIIHSISY